MHDNVVRNHELKYSEGRRLLREGGGEGEGGREKRVHEACKIPVLFLSFSPHSSCLMSAAALSVWDG